LPKNYKKQKEERYANPTPLSQSLSTSLSTSAADSGQRFCVMWVSNAFGNTQQTPRRISVLCFVG